MAPLPGSAAMQLFQQRATAVRPNFAVTSENKAAIQAICDRLDGLPLAIELAAARTKILSPRAILERLQSRLDLLTKGASDLPERQRTLRRTIDWSYDLLTVAEQRLFWRFSAFVGGGTLEATEAVCNTGEDLEIGVFEGLGSLLDKNLVQRVDNPDAEPRFTMLETIREYALERLASNCTVALTFTPSAAGGRYASLTITSDGSNSPRIVTLTGSGVNGQPGITLSPNSPLSFGNQDKGTQTAVSTVTLTNSGTAALTITSISSSTDFPESNTCSASLAAGASCTISIAFAPSQVGLENGTLTLTDSAGVQTLGLTGTGTAPTVTVGSAGGGSLTSTVGKGQTATYALALTGSAGFSGTVSLACSGAPQYATCALSSSTITLTPGSAKPFTATVSTQTSTAAVVSGNAGFIAGASIVAFSLLLPWRKRRGALVASWCIAALLALTGLSGCGGSGGGSTTPPPLVHYTAPGTYNLTITATSGSTVVTQTIVLTVQ